MTPPKTYDGYYDYWDMPSSDAESHWSEPSDDFVALFDSYEEDEA